MKILALGAHPDDIEIFMYGLLTAFKLRGDKIFSIVATDGSMGGEKKGEQLKTTRKQEAIAGLKKLSTPTFLDLPDSQLGDDINHKKIIKENILRINPDLIVTHFSKDYHADHRSLSSITSSSVSHYIPILYCDTLMGINFVPNYYIDITKYSEMKKNAILEHKSQNPERFVDLFKLMNSYRSAQCNLPKGSYAEAYTFISSFPFADITSILPSSPNIRPFYIDNQNGFL